MVVPVWLERDLVITCHFTKVFFQLSEEFLITFCLIQRHKRVDVGKLFPCNGLKENPPLIYKAFIE